MKLDIMTDIEILDNKVSIFTTEFNRDTLASILSMFIQDMSLHKLASDPWYTKGNIVVKVHDKESYVEINNLEIDYRYVRVLAFILNTKYEKTKPEFFKTIKNIIKDLENPRPHYYTSLFHSVIVKDNDDNVIEKLIKFDYNTFSFKYYKFDADDEFNIVKMLYNCTESLIEYKQFINEN